MAKTFPRLACLAALLASPAAAQTAYTPPETTISDNVTYTVHWDGSYTFEEAVTLRLNTENAVENDGQAYIYDNGPADQIIILNAYTKTASGNRIDVLPSQILDQPSGDDQDGIYSNATRKVLIFPDLSPGATLHYHYIIAANGNYFPGQFFAEQIFPEDNATQSASVTVTVPAALKLFFQAASMQGGQVADVKPGESKFVFTAQNMPALPPEDGSEDVTDFSPRLEMTSFPNFAAVGAAYEQDAGPQAAVTPNVRQLADTITRNLTTPRARAVALYNWVSRNIRYVAVDLGYDGYTPNPADDILAAGYGDCKDHVTLLRALLAAEGIESSGAMVNLGGGYFTPQVAVPSFNHIITYLPQLHLFVDSTAQLAPFGVLPNDELGKQALLTGAPGVAPGLVALPVANAVPDVARETTDAVIAPDGTITGTTIIANSGRYELEDRAAFDRMPPGTAAARAAALLDAYGEQGSGDVTPSTDPDDLTQPFVITGHFILPDYAAMPGPATVPLPIGLRHGLVFFQHLNALASLTLPKPCLPQNIYETISLQFPAGIAIKSIPAGMKFTNPIGGYVSSYTLQGRTVHAQRHLVTHPAGAVCSPAEYLQLRGLSFAIGRDLRAAVVY